MSLAMIYSVSAMSNQMTSKGIFVGGSELILVYDNDCIAMFTTRYIVNWK